MSPGLPLASVHAGFASQVILALLIWKQEFQLARTPISGLRQLQSRSLRACVLQLEELGMLKLDETIDGYFPTFPKADKITISQLLTHTSGIANWWGRLPDDAPEDFMNTGQAYEWLSKMEPIFSFEPGTMREYSNSGYVLLGQIIEMVTGKSLNDALQYFVLSRVGAGATFLEDAPKKLPDWAAGYDLDAGRLVSAQYVPPPFAAGGLRANLP